MKAPPKLSQAGYQSSTPDIQCANDKQSPIFENLAADPTHVNREWLDSASAAEYLRISVGTLRNLTSSGQVPYYKFGRRNRYRVSDLRNLLLGQKRGVSYGN